MFKYATLAIVFIFAPLLGWAESITHLHTDILVNPDSSLTITETIDYDFGPDNRHGIFRYAPIVYQVPDELDREVKITVQHVTRNDVVEPYVTETERDNLFIKVGDADVYVTGSQEYTLRYKVEGAIRYQFDDFDEVFWNVTGNDWQVPIQQVTGRLRFDGATFGQAACYVGAYGATDRCGYEHTSSGLYFEHDQVLQPGEGVSIAADLPKGILPVVVFEHKDYTAYIVSAIAGLLGVFGITLWRAYRKHYRVKSVVAQYEPYEDYRAIFAGTLVDGKVDARDIVAGLLSLARDGFVRLNKLEKKFLGLFSSNDWELTLLRPLPEATTVAEQDILRLIFGGAAQVGTVMQLSKVVTVWNKQSQANLVESMKKDLKDHLLTRQYQERFWLGLRRWTRQGYDAINYLQGFKLFLSVTEAERMKFHNAPDRSPQQFMQYLPYAVAFGVEKEWASQFDSLDIAQPDWLQGASVVHAGALVGELSSISSQLGVELQTATVSSGSGSSGGGFSGGGFGGGGGGSW